MQRTNYDDIYRQAESLPETVAAVTNAEPLPLTVRPETTYVFTGCGSSYYVAHCAARLLRALSRVPAFAVPSSEVWLLPELYLKPDCVLVAISRSGTTTEVVRAAERAREGGLQAIGISLNCDTPLGELTEVCLELSHVRETGRVMTGSFLNMLFAAQWLAVRIAGRSEDANAKVYVEGLRRAAEAVGGSLPELDRQAEEIVERGVDQYVFLGSGPFRGVCAEAELKVKEMSRLAAQSYSTLEFRHGPIATLTERSAVVLVSCPSTRPFDRVVVDDLQLLGGIAVVVGPENGGAGANRVVSVELPWGLPDWLYGNMAMPFFQLLGYYQALWVGTDPDSVRYLDKKMEPHIDPHTVELEDRSGI